MKQHPNYITHLTSDISRLKGILNGCFSLSYAREHLVGPTRSYKYAIPMVSFCDIHLNQLEEHSSKYGFYGISLNKEWAKRNGLNAILYGNSESEVMDEIQTGFLIARDASSEELLTDDRLYEQASALVNILRYTKNYDGELERNGVILDGLFRFAEEKEWRYVLPMEEDNFLVPFDDIHTFSPDLKQHYNELIKDHKLKFEFGDIEYIILKEKVEKTEIMEYAKVIYPNIDPDIISSKIISFEEVF